MVIYDGTIKERGNHTELIKTKGIYRKLGKLLFFFFILYIYPYFLVKHQIMIDSSYSEISF